MIKRNLRKNISGIIILSMVLTLFAGLTGEAAVSIRNPGFEELNAAGTMANEWSAPVRYNVTASADNPHSGNYCLKLTTDGNGERSPYAIQVVDVFGDAEYRIDAWVKVTDSPLGAAALPVEYYGPVDGVRSYIGAAGASSTANIADGVWKQISNTFTTPVNCNSLVIFLRKYDLGTAYFDDISITMLREPPKASLDTDWAFYYSDWTGSGKASITVSSYFEELSETGVVDFTLKDGATVLTFADDVPVVGCMADFYYQLSLLSEKKKEYTVEAVLRDSAGTVQAIVNSPVYKYDRPAYLTEDGIFIKNGKRIDPFFGTNCDIMHYPIWPEAGVNVATAWPSFGDLVSYLNEAEENGLMVMLILYPNAKPAGHPDNVGFTQQMVTLAKDHPALFGYYIMDEPFAHAWVTEEMMRNSYKIIRDIDPNHPIYATETQFYHKSAKYVDILGIDPYGQPWTKTVITKTEAALEATEYKKPVYAVLQAFRNGGYFPEPDDLRLMMYQALWAGAKGIGFYGMIVSDAAAGLQLYQTGLWPVLMEFSEKEKEIVFKHFTDDVYTEMTESRSGSVWWRAWKNNETAYVLALCQSGEPSTTSSFTVPWAEAGARLRIINGGAPEQATFENGLLTVTLTACQAVLYEIKPPPDVTGIQFRKGNVIIESLLPGSFAAYVHIAETEPVKVTAMVALYEETDTRATLISIECVVRYSGGDFDIPVEIESVADSRYVLKAFLWDDVSEIKPYSLYDSIKNQI